MAAAVQFLWVDPGLLLLCMVASEVWGTETKPIEFVCSRTARKAMNIGPEIETALSDCINSTSLSTLVQLPCTELHIATWGEKTDQEKRGDIVASLNLLFEGVKNLRILTEGECGTVPLQRLENNINNYLMILTHLQLSVSRVITLMDCMNYQ
ncbi:unnamed protein product [Menidia menidia]|uniref:(Atlantic silverside) hypothetical protein n=1 Tax=Menidia menidia TaxID=238744 RepID=A0A8S4AUQ7_9TELE|nr:unnamed protein product [Menidia menidia]